MRDSFAGERRQGTSPACSEGGATGPDSPICPALDRSGWKVVMKALFSIIVAWALCGAIAAFFSFGPALLRIVAFGPISLAQAVLA